MDTNRRASPATTAALAFLLSTSLLSNVYASAGTAGASFLDIPVGAGPASLGSAYSALAADAYAPVWNPAGLGFLNGNELAGQHLSYLESTHDEFLSFVHPFDDANHASHRGIGFSAQYLGTGDIARTDIDSMGGFLSPGGSFSSHYGSYNLAYGQTVTDKLSLGASGKWINAQIDDVSANAYAMDFGGLYQATRGVKLAATVNNIGTKLKFLDEGDSLPLGFHLGGSYEPNGQWLLSTEGVYSKDAPLSFHVGGAWRPIDALSLRVGYHTDTLDGLSALAGFTAGIGLRAWGQEFAYAWAPYGDLGNAQYFSLIVRFGAREEEKRNLIQYQTIKQHRTVQNGRTKDGEPEYQQLMQLLSDEENTHVAQRTAPNGGAQ
jgi:hypothetical protein